MHKSWFTPLKREVWWPPYKQQSSFNKAVQKGEIPDENSWKLYSVHRLCFYEGLFVVIFKN